MQIKDLYKFTRSDGGTSVSLKEPEGQDYSILIRLIADEGKALTKDNISFHSCIDVESSDGWNEVDYDEETGTSVGVSPEILEKAQAYDIIMGVSE